ncbi:MAG TPA: hypothetical protein VGH42_14295 [Verrucomicrobiae bacterium]|jgi:hypothetical protein
MSQVSPFLEQAQAAPAKPGRSKLEEHRATIFELRRKRWTYAAIAAWLRERGIEATTSNVHRYCQAARRTPKAESPKSITAIFKPAEPPSPAPTGEAKTIRKYRFNLDV